MYMWFFYSMGNTVLRRCCVSRHGSVRSFVSLCLFLRRAVFLPPWLLKDKGREGTDGNNDNCLRWALREMHNAYKVSSKVNGKTINLLYLYCLRYRRLWAPQQLSGIYPQDYMRRRSVFHWGRERLFVLPKVILMEQEFEAGCFKSFSCLDGCRIPRGLLNGCVLYPAHPSGHPSCLIPNTSSHMWSIIPSEDQVENNLCLAVSHASTHQKLTLVKWISIQFNYKGSMYHTKIHVIFLQLTKNPCPS